MVRLSKILAFALLLTVCLPAQVLRVNHGLIPATAAAWTPASETGLKLWLKADAGTYTDAGTSTPTTDGSKLRHWVDQSGNSFDFFGDPASSADRPYWYSTTHSQNSLPLVYFDGPAGDFLTNTTMSFGPGNLTVCAAVQFTSSAKEKDLFDSNNIGFVCGFDDNDTSGLVQYYDGTHDISGTHGLAGAFGVVIWSLSSTGTSGFIYVNNVQKANGLYSQVTIASPNCLGTLHTINQEYAGYLGDFIVYDHALDSTARGNLWTYEKARWGL